MKVEYPLTYFTNRTTDELDEIIKELVTILPKGEIVNLFVERFNPEELSKVYGIDVTDKFIKSINKTLEYAIDTEMLIRYIFDKVEETSL